LTTSRDTTKLAFLTLAVLNVGIMNFGCFETGYFSFGCAGAGQIGFFGFHYWRFWHWQIWRAPEGIILPYLVKVRNRSSHLAKISFSVKSPKKALISYFQYDKMQFSQAKWYF
jgi:hypothetical protein